MPSHIHQQQRTCHYCRRAFPTTGGVRRHISHSRACREQWEIQAQQAPHIAGTPNQDSDREHDGINEDIDLLLPLPDVRLGVADDIDQHEGWHDVDLPGREPDRQESHVQEDVHEDEHGSHFPRFAQEFSEKPAAEVIGHEQTPFERMKGHQEATGGGPYAPFADHEEWALAQWLIKNVNQRATEEFLKLPIVSFLSAWDLLEH